jgi:hypothetical protein
MLGRLALTLALAAFVCPTALFAQSLQSETDTTAPAHVAHVDGPLNSVTLEREGRADTSPLNVPLLSGDRLRTLDGRVEVLFADGSTLHLDARSTIDVQSDELLRLTEGRLRLNIHGALDAARGGAASGVAYRIDSPAGSARITQPGEYRIALLKGNEETQLEVAVLRGGAEVVTDQGSTTIRAGERAYASAGLAPSYAYSYNSANWDAFDRWSEARRDVRLGVSSQYLPSDMQEYAPLLDESGDWRYDQSYGNVWYPRVAADWRPYYYGRWDSYPRYGWTWIGSDRFAWPTHHYGRWGFSAGVWFWIPSSRWAPAYVSWAYAPGYVSWCPLGFDNRPIIAIDLSRVGPGYYSPWRAWTAVSDSHFGGRGYYVNQRAVNWDRAGGQRPHFEPRASSPGLTRDIAVARNSTPVRYAGSRNRPPAVDGAQARDGGSHGMPSGSGGSPRANSGPSGGNSPRSSWLPPSGGRNSGRDVAAPRTSASPRYVNRGDEIVRSDTARPIPGGAPGATPGGLPVDRGSAVSRGPDTRTMPAGPARPARPESSPADAGQSRPRASESPAYQPRGYQPRTVTPSREPGPQSYQPVDRTPARPIDRAQDNPAVGQHPAYQPSYQPAPSQPAPHQPSPYQPRVYDPRPVTPAREAAPRKEPSDGAQGAPERDPRPTERAPNRGEGRQPPPERAAPPSRPAPGPSGGVAVPRRGRGGL